MLGGISIPLDRKIDGCPGLLEVLLRELRELTLVFFLRRGMGPAWVTVILKTPATSAAMSLFQISRYVYPSRRPATTQDAFQRV